MRVVPYGYVDGRCAQATFVVGGPESRGLSRWLRKMSSLNARNFDPESHCSHCYRVVVALSLTVTSERVRGVRTNSGRGVHSLIY